MLLDTTVPFTELPSAANQRLHWSRRAGQTKRQRQTMASGLRPHIVAQRRCYEHLTVHQGTLVVTLTRIVQDGRSFIRDAHDNLPMSLKAVVDELAKWLGVDDSDPRLLWRYLQEADIGAPCQRRPGYAAVRVVIEAAGGEAL